MSEPGRGLVERAVTRVLTPGTVAEPGLLPQVIEEVLRFRPPVQAAFRQAVRDVEVRGKTIPAGSLILLMIGAANRDPRQFPRPGRFDITRQPNAHIAFGHGIHFCIGAALARVEARVALTRFLERVPRFTLAAKWEPQPGFHVHGPTRLPIRLT